MRFRLSAAVEGLNAVPAGIKVLVLAFLWLVVISMLHWKMNYDHGTQRVIRMGYMPVISNLACPLLAEATKDREDFRLEAVKFASFADMGEALRSGKIQVAFMIAPLAIVLRQQGEDLRVVYIGNRHESTLVVDTQSGIRTFSDLADKTVAVPMRYSGHYLAMRALARKFGLEKRIHIVEMNPPDMPSAMGADALDAYFVGEPFAARAVMSGDARVLFPVRKIWPGFICNLMLMPGSFIEKDKEIAEKIVHWAVRSNVWASQNPEEAAAVAARYWNQPEELVLHALTDPESQVEYGLYEPQEQEMELMAEQMKEFGLVKDTAIDGLVDARFARSTDKTGVTNLLSITNTP